MSNLFADIPEALTNTVNIAKKCNFKFKTNQVALPAYLPSNSLSVEEYLKREAKQGLDQLINDNEKLKKIYFERLNTELDIIFSIAFGISLRKSLAIKLYDFFLNNSSPI